MKKILFITLACLFIVGCDDDDNAANSDNAEQPSLAQISGVWDFTDTYEGEDEKDIAYLVIKDHGEFIIYDYLGDAFDQGSDCYFQVNSSITDLGNGEFEIGTFGEFFTLNMSTSNSDLILTEASSGDSAAFPSTALTEDDFTPNCLDVFTSNLSRDTTGKNYLKRSVK